MTFKAVPTDILNALEDLEDKAFDKFCYALRHGPKPEILASEVEKKARVEVAKLLLSRCTEAGALVRVIETLKHIGCNDEAKKLESRNNAHLHASVKEEPTTSNESAPAPAQPLRVRATNQQKEPQKRKKVVAKTKTTVRPGLTILQFGKHKGKSFNWLVKNDVGYAGYVVATHQREREGGNTCQDPFMKHKDALAQYTSQFSVAVKEIHFYHQGLDPLGFGRYPQVTLQDLYNSKNKDMKSYVNYLRGMEKKCTIGSAMEAAIKYVLHRDKTNTNSAPRWVSPRRTTSPEAQSETKTRRLY